MHTMHYRATHHDYDSNQSKLTSKRHLIQINVQLAGSIICRHFIPHHARRHAIEHGRHISNKNLLSQAQFVTQNNGSHLHNLYRSRTQCTINRLTTYQ